MAEETAIEWTNRVLPDGTVINGSTFNGWIGCEKVSPACTNCYAERDMVRRDAVTWGPLSKGATRVLTTEAYWHGPEKWARKAELSGMRSLVFCHSLADVGEVWSGPMIDSHGRMMMKHRQWPHAFKPFALQASPQNLRADWQEVALKNGPEWSYVTMDDARRALFRLIAKTVTLDWLLLTKRPEVLLDQWTALACEYREELQRMIEGRGTILSIGTYRAAAAYFDKTGLIGNIWTGVTAENQEWADKRLPYLDNIPTPRHFVSVEPQVGPVILQGSLPGKVFNWLGKAHRCPQSIKDARGIHWVIQGGESGRDARPVHSEWVRSLKDQCVMSGTDFFLKQWGEWLPIDHVTPEMVTKHTPYKDMYPDGKSRTTAEEREEVRLGRVPLPMLTYRVGKHEAGRTLDGKLWNQIPDPVL